MRMLKYSPCSGRGRDQDRFPGGKMEHHRKTEHFSRLALVPGPGLYPLPGRTFDAESENQGPET